MDSGDFKNDHVRTLCAGHIDEYLAEIQDYEVALDVLGIDQETKKGKTK